MNREIDRNDEATINLRKELLVSLQESDQKYKNFDNLLKMETEKIVSVKKDIFSQLYDFNINISGKLDSVNENFIHKFESVEKNFKKFKLDLIEENEKFSQYLIDQHENSQKNLSKLQDLNNEEIKIVSEKVKFIKSDK